MTKWIWDDEGQLNVTSREEVPMKHDIALDYVDSTVVMEPPPFCPSANLYTNPNSNARISVQSSGQFFSSFGNGISVRMCGFFSLFSCFSGPDFGSKLLSFSRIERKLRSSCTDWIAGVETLRSGRRDADLQQDLVSERRRSAQGFYCYKQCRMNKSTFEIMCKGNFLKDETNRNGRYSSSIFHILKGKVQNKCTQ